MNKTHPEDVVFGIRDIESASEPLGALQSVGDVAEQHRLHAVVE